MIASILGFRRVATFVTLLAILLLGNTVFAQSTALYPGDIMMVGIHTDDVGGNANRDQFTFMATRAIPGSTQIFFTDNGVFGRELMITEGTVTYTAPAGGLIAGSFVTIVVTGATVNTVSSGSATSTSTFSLSTGGDQVFAYTGSASNPFFLSAVSTNGYLNGTNDATAATTNFPNTNRSWVPQGLVYGQTAYSLTESGTDIDNGQVTPNATARSKDEWITRIAAFATSVLTNWSTSNSAITPWPATSTAYNMSGSISAPTITSFAPATAKVGDLITINGTNLTYANIQVNGLRGVIRSRTATQATFQVAGGSTTGPITAANSAGTVATSSNLVIDNAGFTQIAFQGFEGTASDNWGFLNGAVPSQISADAGAGNFPANQKIRTGTKSWQNLGSDGVTVPEVVELSKVNIAGYTNVQILLRVSSTPTSSGQGMDEDNWIRIYTPRDAESYPGTALSPTTRVTDAVVHLEGNPTGAIFSATNRNSRWGYNATLEAIGRAGENSRFASPQGGESTNNYSLIRISVPDGTTQVGLKVLVRSSSDENVSIDDIELVGTPPPVVNPTKLAIHTINGGQNASAGLPFSVVVRSLDNSNIAQDVTAATSFTLSAAGPGTIGGTITGTIPAGDNEVTVTGVTYSAAATNVTFTATRTGGDVLSAGTGTATILAKYNQLQLTNTPTSTRAVNEHIGNFTVTAIRPDATTDLNFNGPVTITKNTGPSLGTVGGTVTVNAVQGVATFTNITLNTPGVYTIIASDGAIDVVSTGFAAANVIALQGFESTVADTWTVSGSLTPARNTTPGASDFPANNRIRTGTGSYRYNGDGNTATNNLVSISTVGYTNMQVVLRVSTAGSDAGQGPDAADQLNVFVALNGGAFSGTSDVRLTGTTDSRWGYSGSQTAETSAGTQVINASPSNFTTLGYSTIRINIPNGTTSVALRWTCLNNSTNENWNIDDIQLLGVPFSIWYSKPTGELTTLSTWGDLPNGTGQSPTTFDNAFDVFRIQNRANATLNQNWTLGVSTFAEVGSFTTLTVPSGITVGGTVTVNANGTLRLLGLSSLPNIGSLNPVSTVEFGGNGNQTIPALSFSTLKLSGTGVKTLASGSQTFSGSLIADGVSISKPGATAAITIGGNLELINGATMNDNCLTSFGLTLSSNAVNKLIGNGSTIKLNSLTINKQSGKGGVELASNTPVRIVDRLLVNMTSCTDVFRDGGNTIQVGSDIMFSGVANDYALTGTLEMTGESNTSGVFVLGDVGGTAGTISPSTSGTIDVAINHLRIKRTTGTWTFQLMGNSATGVSVNNFELDGAALETKGTGSNGALTIRGNLTMLNGATVSTNWLNNVPVAMSEFNQTVSTNGSTFRCLIFTANRPNGGALTVADNSNMETTSLQASLGTASGNIGSFTFGNGLLRIVGQINITGTTGRGTVTGTLQMAGSTNANLNAASPLTVTRLEVLNTGSTGVSLTASSIVNVTEKLELGANARLTIPGTNAVPTATLRLVSSNTGTAYLAQVPATAVITGGITVERFLTNTGVGPAGRNYMLAVPLRGNGGVPLQSSVFGSNGNNLTFNGAGGRSSVFYFDNAQTAPFGGWVGATGATDTVGYRGAQVFVQRPVIFGTSKLAFTGAPITGTRGINVKRTATLGSNLIPNPYPANIDWNSTAITVPANVGNAIYIWNDATKQYSTYLRNTSLSPGLYSGLNGGTNIINSGQAFFTIVESGTTAQIVFTEAAKTTTTTSMLRLANTQAGMKVTVKNTTQADELEVRMNAQAQPAFEPQFDARKLMNTNLNIFAQWSSSPMAIYTSNQPAEQSSIMLGFNSLTAGNHTLRFDNVGIFGQQQVTLVDQIAGTLTPVVDGMTYDFQHQLSQNSQQRFYLVFGSVPTSITASLSHVKLSVAPNPTRDNVFVNGLTKAASYKLINALGQQVTSGQVSPEANSINLVEFTAGTYQLLINNGVTVEKALVIIER